MHSRGLEPDGKRCIPDLMLDLHEPDGKGAYRIRFSISIISVYTSPEAGVSRDTADPDKGQCI